MFGEDPAISRWIAEMYERDVTESEDIDLLLALIGSAPLHVLEVCCGSGRMLVALARAGHGVAGFDADEAMLARIADKASDLDNIHWWHGDAIHDPWGAGYDLVVLGGNILFNIVSDVAYERAQELLVRNAAAALAAGGRLYLDYSPGGHSVMHPDEVSGGDRPRVIWEGTDSEGTCGRMVLLPGSYDPATRMDTFTRRFELRLASGERIVQEIPSGKHVASLAQLHRWLADAGFTIEHEFADYARRPIDLFSTRVVILARLDPPTPTA